MRFISLSMKKPLFILILLILSLLVALFLLQSRWIWHLFYPLHYEREVYGAADESSLDPYLLFAIIYVESRFNTRVESRSGAKGLMQIMPGTGEWIAEKKGVQNFSEEDLYDPSINISFGSWYLSHLLHHYNENLVLALAAYNAGIGNVNHWITRGIWDGTWESRKSIPFKETEAYIERVFFIYDRYETIYGSRSLWFFKNPPYPYGLQVFVEIGVNC